jgi:hypothetical protein
MAALVPVPVSFAVATDAAVLRTLSWPWRLPTAEGANTTWTVQD